MHPGEILREKLDEFGLSAKVQGVPVNRVTMILNGQWGERGHGVAPGSVLRDDAATVA